LSNFNETCILRQIFEEYSNTKFHENLSSGSRRTDMKMLTVTFCTFANMPKKEDIFKPLMSSISKHAT